MGEREVHAAVELPILFAHLVGGLDRIAALVAATEPASYRNYTAGVVDLHEFSMLFRSGLRAPLLILLGGAGFLLLIACANVATLLLARSVARARETAIRVALGASRRQLAMRYFAEGALVSVAGAAAGGALERFGGGVQIAGTVIDDGDAHREPPGSGNNPMISLRGNGGGRENGWPGISLVGGGAPRSTAT